MVLLLFILNKAVLCDFLREISVTSYAQSSPSSHTTAAVHRCGTAFH